MRFVGLILLALVAATAGALYLDAFLEDTVVVEVPSVSAPAGTEGVSRDATPPAIPTADTAVTQPVASAPSGGAAPDASPPDAVSEPAPAVSRNDRQIAGVAPSAPPGLPAAAPIPAAGGAQQAAGSVPDPASHATGEAAIAMQSQPPSPASGPAPVTQPASAPPPSALPSGRPADATPLPPPHTPDMRIARDAFGAAKTPAPLAARSIGFYSRGCLAGGRALPVDGPAWQAMRLSRNRNWGHPNLVRYVERLATDAKTMDRWPGLMVGDLSQPRGGPMTSGHASHQIGLDADIWFTPMPDRRLTPKEREDLAATDMLGSYKLSVDPAVWSEAQLKLLKRASSYAEVERILVHPAIKKAVCEQAGADREWLKKIRPYWGHHYHFHVRIACPPGSIGCTGQAPPPNDDGCGKELDDWFHLLSRPTKPPPPEPVTPAPAPHPLRVDQLPAECRQVLDGREPLFKRLFKRAPAATKAAAKPAAHHGALASPPKHAR